MISWKDKEWDKIDVVEFHTLNTTAYYIWFHYPDGWYTHTWSVNGSNFFLLLTDNFFPPLSYYSANNVAYDKYYYTQHNMIVYSLSNITELIDFCAKIVTEKLL